jgi:3-phosphoglycerate kinase
VNAEEFRLLRTRDTQVTAAITTAHGGKGIDWAAWDDRISNKEVLNSLKEFHKQQTSLLDSVIREDHQTAVKGQDAGWELFDEAVKSCKKSVEKSEEILTNGLEHCGSHFTIHQFHQFHRASGSTLISTGRHLLRSIIITTIICAMQ